MSTDQQTTEILTPQQKAARTKQSKLTAKEIVFLKELAKGKTGTEAALIAYDTKNYNTAAAISSENLQKPKLRVALEAAYEKAGITPQSIADVLSDAMLATKTSAVAGEVLPSTQPDHGIRVQAARVAATLIGAGSKEDGGGDTFNFNLGNQTYVKNVEVKPQGS